MHTTDRASSHQPHANIHVDMQHGMLSPAGGDLYEDQYDEHGVRIERQMSDAELLRQYMG